MKKIAILLTLMILAISIVACSKQETVQPVQLAPVSVEPPKAPEPAVIEKAPVVQEEVKAPEPVKTVSYEITPETKARLDAKFTKGTQYALSENFKKMKPGDVYVFALGLTNLKTDADNFLVKASFNKAYDKSSNLITSEKSLLEPWISRNTFGSKFELKGNEQAVLPLIIEAKNLADGSVPKPGTYVFDVVAYNQGTRSDVTNEYAVMQVSVQIEG